MLQLILSILLAACLSVLFLRIVREDNASGKIRNARIGAGLALVGVAVLLLALQTAAHQLLSVNFPFLVPHLPAAYFLKYLQHGLTALIAAVVLWKAGTWPAGDAKLFILSALAIPVIIPDAAHFPGILFLALLVNIFIPAGFVFLLESANTVKTRLIGESRGETARAVALGAGELVRSLAAASGKPGKLASFLLLTAIFGAVRFLKESYAGSLHINETLFFAFMMLAWPALSSLLKTGGNLALGTAGVCAVLCSLHPLGREILVSAAFGLTRSLPFIALNKAIRGLMGQDASRTIPLDALSQGVILTENYFKKIKTAAPDFFSDNFSSIYPDGLTARQAEQLKIIISRSDAPGLDLSIITTRTGQPFAGWIAAGTLLTLALHGKTLTILWKSILRLLNA
ncbi:MAG: hypothetical protein A2285_04955 [Elusimicrobia bacterium RIFOXYA12_FULL_57_11]|nr:MAG: hypothetical protein A2285_04955 [Elusimicrobia bacterium RIFOXYA12_FULL_57_11]